MGVKTSKQQMRTVEISTYFEEFSNDLIYEIFDYLSYHNILHAFKNLNQRFDFLIDTYSHYVNLQQYNDNESLPENILILKISGQYQLKFIDFSKIKLLHGLMISNLSMNTVLNILNTVVLDYLEYVYLGVTNSYETSDGGLTVIQEKILSLGNQNLQKCVFRMGFLGKIDRLPKTLPTIEYFRIDGCENVFEITRLLNRMPNLVTLYASILSSNTNIDFLKENIRHEYLRKLNLRFSTMIKFDELNILFINHGSYLKKLILQLNIYEDNFKDYSVENIRPKLRTLVNEYLPQLTHVHIRYHRLHLNNIFLRPKIATQVKQIPLSKEHQAFEMKFSYS